MTDAAVSRMSQKMRVPFLGIEPAGFRRDFYYSSHRTGIKARW
jgi:hypothetical protein